MKKVVPFWFLARAVLIAPAVVMSIIGIIGERWMDAVDRHLPRARKHVNPENHGGE